MVAFIYYNWPDKLGFLYLIMYIYSPTPKIALLFTPK